MPTHVVAHLGKLLEKGDGGRTSSAGKKNKGQNNVRRETWCLIPPTPPPRFETSTGMWVRIDPLNGVFNRYPSAIHRCCSVIPKIKGRYEGAATSTEREQRYMYFAEQRIVRRSFTEFVS